MGNRNLRRAKKAKNDEFYTQLEDIEKELMHYKDQFRGKVVFCNCDDPEYSNFWLYFKLNFKHLGLKKLISTHYDPEEPTYKLEYDGQEIVKTKLKQNGDFRSPEAIEILKQSDIICTNPPFSLFRKYLTQLIKYKKDFLIMGNNNAITYKEIFPLLKKNKMWLGHNSNKTLEFRLSDDYEKWDRIDEEGNKYGKVPAISWFTSLDVAKRHEEIILYREYRGNEEKYPKYDNYDAIEVSRVANIPYDYDGIMGVPITFMTKYNPEQFEIIGSRRWAKSQELLDVYCGDVNPPENDKKTTINGKETYDRIFIRHKRKEANNEDYAKASNY